MQGPVRVVEENFAQGEVEDEVDDDLRNGGETRGDWI